MELLYPMTIIICVVLAIVICFAKITKKRRYTSGKKVANTSYIKQTDYYKAKVKRYRLLTNCVKGLLVACIAVSSVLIARPVTVQTMDSEEYNRDIMLGLDVSGSQDEVNYELVRKFKKIIPDIKGDRIGIVIFNTSPLLYCPLTDDYDYVNECLDNIEKAIKAELNKQDEIFDGDYKTTSILYDGVSVGSDERGSSLIGDGLAGTLYSFSEVKANDDRTRIIIFATDNDLSGTETVTLNDACILCKKYNVKLYAHSPTSQMNAYATPEKIAAYKKSVEGAAGGKFFTGDLGQSLSKIVEEIKETKTSRIRDNKKTLVIDHPEAFLVITFLLFIVLVSLEKFLLI